MRIRNSAASADRLSAEETISTLAPVTSIKSRRRAGPPPGHSRRGADDAKTVAKVLRTEDGERRLAGLKGLSHVTVEVETCPH